MNEFYIGSSNSMTKTIQLDKVYKKNAILFLNSSNYNDKFDYTINDDILTINRIDFLNVNEIRDEDFQDIVDIGTNNTHIKTIELNKSYSYNSAIKLESNIWPDNFSFKIYNNKLIVIRKDKKEGWNYNHKVKIHQGWSNELKGYIYEDSDIIHYSIGINDKSNEKRISLNGFYPEGCLLCTENHNYGDRFLVKFQNNELIVHRYDKNEGWLHSHNIYAIRSVIPKNILQTHHSDLPHNVRDHLNKKAHGYNYEFFKDEDIVIFMKNNPLQEFPNIVDRFNNIKIGQHKADLFRYYYLYIKGGVFIDSDAMIQKNLDDIIVSYNFVTIICRDPSLYFNGFIATEPLNIIMYEAIKAIYYCNLNDLNNDYFRIVRDFKIIVDNHKNKFKYKLYLEKGDWNGMMPTVDEQNNDEVILKHYYGSKVVPNL